MGVRQNRAINLKRVVLGVEQFKGICIFSKALDRTVLVGIMLLIWLADPNIPDEFRPISVMRKTALKILILG